MHNDVKNIYLARLKVFFQYKYLQQKSDPALLLNPTQRCSKTDMYEINMNDKASVKKNRMCMKSFHKRLQMMHADNSELLQKLKYVTVQDRTTNYLLNLEQFLAHSR